MTDVSRRTAMGTVAAGTAGLAATAPIAAAQVAGTPTALPAFAANHQPKPLAFDPAKLDGLSERLIRSHWENNYQGSVKALNLVETRLSAALADPDFPALIYGDIKREQLHRTGSVVLHELYFGALGGNGRVGGDIEQALARSFGSFATWETEFRRTALSLAGGSGWVMLAFNTHTSALQNYWAWDHMHSAVMGVPLLVLDMYEHSYHMDYGTAAARYIDAFMTNLDWEVVDARYRAATS
jgi:superoxide dismutase, Fe-Mn family